MACPGTSHECTLHAHETDSEVEGIIRFMHDLLPSHLVTTGLERGQPQLKVAWLMHIVR